jgi:ubiquinone/menaquinone biosynthesis C-methylase UbiE
MQLTEQGLKVWQAFLANQDNHGHAKRVLAGPHIDVHVNACWKSALDTATRIKSELPDIKPRRILEIGCSAGLNCYALQQTYPNAEVIGIEPEQEAVNVARAMLNGESTAQLHFQQGFGEKLPLADESADLIVCHTVIEHVNDVETVINEMSRVLSPSGFIHLDAPNYRFPYEPHLGIVTIPSFGKKFVKFSALLQGRWKQRNFLNHLKFVTPASLQRHFSKYGLQWHNRSIDKLDAAMNGYGDIKKYRRIAKFLKLLHRFGLGKPIVSALGAAGLYPSVLYTLRKGTDE